jgi:hypothetical protein
MLYQSLMRWGERLARVKIHNHHVADAVYTHHIVYGTMMCDAMQYFKMFNDRR